MGQGVSQDQIAAHLARQSDLIGQLQDVVDKQAKTIEIAATRHVDYSVDGAPTNFETPNFLRDEMEQLSSGAREAESARKEIPITEEEKQNPDIQWVEPTAEEEEQLSQTKPWIAAMAPPTKFEFGKTDGTPDINLQLERVYGFCGASGGARNTALWIDKTTVVYYVGTIGISYNITTKKQTFFTGHTDEICSIAVDRRRKIVATGESGRFPAIYVWNAVTGEQIAKLAGRHRRAVGALCFGRDGRTLATVGIDDSHTLLIYDWEQSKVIGEGSCRNRVLDITPNYTYGHNPNTDFVTCGEGQVVFWSVKAHSGGGGAPSSPKEDSTNGKGGKAGRSSILHHASSQFGIGKTSGGGSSGAGGGANNGGVNYSDSDATNSSTPQTNSDLIHFAVGQLGNLGIRQPFLCVRTTRTHTLVGCANGELYSFRNERLVYCYPCHQGPIHSIVVATVNGESDVIGGSSPSGSPTTTSPPPAGDYGTASSPRDAINNMPPPDVRVYTAGRDGFVSCWDLDTRSRELCINLNKKTSATFSKHGTNAIRTLDVLVDTAEDILAAAGGNAAEAVGRPKKGIRGQLLIGTVNGTLATCNGAGVAYTPITSGHCADLSGNLEGNLWGLAACPVTTRFATCGEDGMLRVWDSSEQREVAAFELPRPAQCVAFARDGHSIAVGYLNGTIGVMTIHDMRKALAERTNIQIRELCEMRRCARRIQCIQYSPDGKWLAAGTADGNVDLYAITEDPFAVAAANVPSTKLVKPEIPLICPGALLDYQLKIRLSSANNSVCMRFDFSKDGKYLQACSQAYELLFYDLTQEPSAPVASGKGLAAVPQIPPMATGEARMKLRDVEWFTYSSLLGWSVQGIWLSSNADGSDVNAVRRSTNGKYLLTGCDTGAIKVFNYPCVGSGLCRDGRLARRPQSKSLAGHGRRVAEVVWSTDDRRVFSIGTLDRCCLQWKVVADVK